MNFASKCDNVISFCACSVDNIYREVLDTRVNLDTRGRANLILIRYVSTRKFSNAQQFFLAVQKYPDTCGRGLIS